MNPPVAPLKIGQVHALLRREHPNLELSKIRYYEEMGLVAPARSRKGYRLYAEKDVECLREAIRLADEEFVPLRVIRIRLMEQGLLKEDQRPVSARHVARATPSNVVSLPVPASATPPPALVAVTNDAGPAPEDSSGETMSANQLLEVSGVEPELLNKIISLGLVAAVTRGGDTTFSARDVRLVQASASLLRRGTDPRQLGALRRVVEREIGIIDILTLDLRGGSSTTDEITAAKLEVARDIEILRAELFEHALNEFLEL